MTKGIYTATAGAIAQRRHLDIVANNLANASTRGYREQRSGFQAVLEDLQDPNRNYVAMAEVQLSTEMAGKQQTGNPLDLTIDGDGFFALEDRGQLVLSRNLSLRVEPNGRVINVGGQTIKTKAGDGFVRSTDNISVNRQGEVHQDGKRIFAIQTVRVANPRFLQPLGNGVYQITEDSGQVLPYQARIESGLQEGSNVNVVRSMVTLVALQRDFESSLDVIKSFQNMDRDLISAAPQG